MGEWYDALPPRHEPTRPHWETAEFREELRAWCESVLGPIDLMEQRKLRGWATVWRVTTPVGAYFAKENCPGQRLEIPLMRMLVRLAPSRVVPVTATTDRFLLTPDQGPTFLETSHDDIDSWARMVREAALLQRELVAHHDAVVVSGPDMLPPARAPDYVAARVDQLAGLRREDPRALDGEVAGRLRAHLPVVRRWAEQVAGLGLPITLNHNDLHENNVFDVDGRLLFFDFGDAVLSEPLALLLIPLNILAGNLDAPPDDPRLWRVAEAALEVWSDLVPLRDLRDALPAALQLGRLGRVESWVRCAPALTDEELAEWGSAAADWLATLLADPPVGSNTP